MVDKKCRRMGAPAKSIQIETTFYTISVVGELSFAMNVLILTIK